MLTKRTNILFDEELWKTLAVAAKRERTSVGELVRTTLKEKYMEEKRLQQRQDAVEAILAFREKYGAKLAKGKDSTIIVSEIRDERYGEKHLRRLRNP